ncbi:MAG: choice-of-anchor D domain-containing protein [Planctomycetes bacterium]|nr:choice-of-anchor D domain-containing protein [Planctomycetota bacterium]
MKIVALIAVIALAGGLSAQDSGDAPASYGTIYSYLTGPGQGSLGTQANDDTTNPVGGDWVSDNDDGIVGSPYWDPWSADNTLTVHVEGMGWLILWVDADDNGHWDATERYRYSPMYVEGPADFTFTGITLTAQQNFSRNGANKVGVRIELQDNFGAGPNLQPSGYFFCGEIEDWLIDVAPVEFTVGTLAVRDGVEGVPKSANISAVHGTAPYTWSMIGGSLPPGMSLTQVADKFLLSGTPSTGAGTGAPTYSFTVQVTDSLAQTAQRTLDLRVLPPPVAAPFKDDFSTDRGWLRDGNWTRDVATAYTGQGFNRYGEVTTEPGVDYTPGTTDNKILADSLGTWFVYGGFMPQTLWATSPVVDCTGLTSVQLRFRRWLSTVRAAGYGTPEDRVRVQASNDGVTWTTVWCPSMQSNEGYLVDVAWTLTTCDISAIAANQPRVQVRFGIGPAVDSTQANPYIATIYDDFAGWCLDDVEVIETPATTMQASNFTVQTTGSLLHPINGLTYPELYPGSLHTWTADVTNTGATPLTISECEVGATVPIQPGATAYDIIGYTSHTSWYDVGTWTAPLPVTVPAGATIQLQGQFLCTGVPLFRADQVFELKLYLRGSAGTGSFEATSVLEAAFSANAQPGLHVWEGPPASTGQTEVYNGGAAAGLRDFGSVAVGAASAWTLIICKTNTSNPFTVDPPTITGADAADFELYTPTTWNNTPHQGQNDCYFHVRFKPTGLGVKNATVTFDHTATNTGTPFSFDVRGSGAGSAPVLRVFDTSTGGVIPNGSGAVGGLDFGMIDIYGAAGVLTIQIENQGNVNLVLGMPQLASGAGYLLDTNSFSSTVAPGATTTFDVVFAPSTIGVVVETVSFTHNDTGTSTPFTFAVAGEGIINAPIVQVTLGSPMGNVISAGAPAGGATQFAPLDVSAGASAALVVFISNHGWQDLQLGSLPSLSGTHSSDFGIDTTGTLLVIAPGQSTSFSIWFDPIAKGPKAATVQITHNDASVANPFTFDLSGMGVDPNGVLITSTVLTPAQVDEDYGTVHMHAAGGTAPYTWALTSGTIPAGLLLAADGAITGTPTGSHGMYHFRVEVTDALGGVDERLIELAVSPPTGYIEKKSGAASGGCTAATSTGPWALLGLIALVSVGRRRRATKK